MTHTPTITIETAMAITDRRSKRTWMRRIEEGAVRQIGPDAGLQTLLVLDDVLPSTSIPLGPDMRAVLIQASMGHAEAQAELGQSFLLAGHHDLAVHWLTQAAQRGSPDAMQWLAVFYAGGTGLARDDEAARRWLRAAAELGHVIARAQMEALPQ